MKEFIVFTFSLIWFILSGVFATIIANYFHLPSNWMLHFLLALIIAFTPIVLIMKIKSNYQKEEQF